MLSTFPAIAHTAMLNLRQKIASVCSSALQSLDSNLFSRLKLLLSDTSPVYDPLVQEAALEAITMLLHKYANTRGLFPVKSNV